MKKLHLDADEYLKETFELSDLVQVDLTGLGEAVEDFVSEYCESHDIEDSDISYGWSCYVDVKIYSKEFNIIADPACRESVVMTTKKEVNIDGTVQENLGT